MMMVVVVMTTTTMMIMMMTTTMMMMMNWDIWFSQNGNIKLSQNSTDVQVSQ
jgi:hypothetical protein